MRKSFSRINPLHGRAVEGEGPWNWKPLRFPAGKDHGIGNHDAFLQERTMELETMTLSCRKGPWNWKPRRFPAGKDHGIGNHDAFLQERIVAVKFIEFRPMQHVAYCQLFPDLTDDAFDFRGAVAW